MERRRGFGRKCGYRRFGDEIFLRIGLEFLKTAIAAKVVNLVAMLGGSLGFFGVHGHAADRVFHGCAVVAAGWSS